MITRTESVSIKVVRRNCLECSGGSARQVLWCPCNGHTSTDCVFWPSRFGKRPETFVNRHGPYLMTVHPHGCEEQLPQAYRTALATGSYPRV